MVKNSTILLIFVLSIGLLSSCLIVQECQALGSSSLTVTVENQSNSSPIAGANVSISGPENHTAISDSNGTVTFSNIVAGNYQVIATAPGYPTRVSYTIQVNGATSAFASFSFTKAYFTYLPSHITTNTTVSFDGSLSSSSGNIVSYYWDFGDSTNGTVMAPTHVYALQGTYTVLLTVTSTVGTARYSQTVSVAAQNENGIFPWILLIIPFLIPIPIFLLRRRRYYVVIQVRSPPTQKRSHCPGDGTKCEDCKLTPC